VFVEVSLDLLLSPPELLFFIWRSFLSILIP